MSWPTIQYLARQAHRGILQNSWNQAVTVVTVSLAVAIFGTFLLVFHNAGRLLEKWRSSVEITVYLKKGLAADKMEAAFAKIRSLDGVASAEKITEDQALQRFRAELGEQRSLLEGLTKNPLPASIEIKLHQEVVETPGKLGALLQEIRPLEGVEEIQSGQQWVHRMSLIKDGMALMNIMVGGGLLVAIVFIISNTIKLTVYAQQEEIEIMRLVGATDSFVRAPFLIEGVLQGGAGALIAIGILIGGFMAAAPIWNENLQGIFLGMKLSFLPWKWLLGLLAGGMVVGALGSFIALARFLES